MKRPVLLALAAVAVASISAACGGHGRPVAPGVASPKAEWTLLVYMAADDDLERASIVNVQELAEAGSGERVNVVVQIDRGPAGKNGRGYTRAPLLNLADFNSTKRLRVDQGRLTELADLGEKSTADPATLASFVEWGIKTFPAPKVALVLWDHGGATAGFGWDVTNDDKPLSVVDTRIAIKNGLAAAGREKLDVLGFDACLMANLGVAYELRDLAEVFVASEEVEPAHGWSYAPIVHALRAPGAALSSRALGKTIVDTFEAECREKKTADLCTMAAFDMSKVEAIAASLDELGDALVAHGSTAERWFRVVRAHGAAEEYGASPGQHSPYGTIDAADFGAGTSRFLKSANHVGEAIDAAAIARFHGAGRPDAHGLSITFPREKKDAKPRDAALELATRAPWGAFMTAYFAHAGADRTPPELSGLVARETADGFDVSVTITGDDVAETSSIIGVTDTNGVVSVLSVTRLPEGASSFRWKRELPIVGDGDSQSRVTLFEHKEYKDDAGQAVRFMSVAGKLAHGGDTSSEVDVALYLKVHAHDAPTVLGVFKYEDGGRAGEVEVSAGDRFTPKLRTIDEKAKGARAWARSDKSIALADQSRIKLSEQPVPAGDYVLGVRVTDYAANAHTVTTHVHVK